MEDYPEELRTPPVALVCLAGCPELHHPISAFLHSEQPPINTLALPDFSKASVLARKKNRDPLSQPTPAPPSGILKRDWLLKHRTRVPAVVAALFRADQISGDPAQWLQACTDLENLKSLIHGRSTRLVVVLVQTQAAEELSEDVMTALRKRAEIDPKHLVEFVQNDATDLRQSLNKLASLFAELCLTYYKEEGRRIRSIIEKKSSPFPELNIRYCFKIAIYAEFRRDWSEALKFYEEAYRVLREMTNTSTRLPPIQRLVEIKTIAEQLHFKISTLLLHGGKIMEAVARFLKHIKTYKRLVGPPEVDFLHWEWYSRQFLVFAELLETTAAGAPSSQSPRFGTAESPFSEWEFQPAYYYQLAANYLREKRCCLEQSSLSKTDLPTKITEAPDSVMPSIHIGQSARLVEEGDIVTVLPLSDAEYVAYALAEAERFQDCYEIIALYKRAQESFSSHGSQRMACLCTLGMAREYYASDDFTNSKQLFDTVAALYRREGWAPLLWEVLGYLRDCAKRLGLTKEYTAYSLEMAALPVFSTGFEKTIDFGPAGPATLSRREEIQREALNFAVETDGDTEPVGLDIDPVSPLRSVLLVAVAFHEQSVKPDSAALLTVSLLSQLPLLFKVGSLEVEFNQPACNFSMPVPLEVSPNKWLRLTHEVKSGQSGKLECLSVKAKINNNLIICCRAESPALMEDLTMWKYENQRETYPTLDPALSLSGQKSIQVDEPNPLVDLTLNSTGPALVGEVFQIPVLVVSTGHVIRGGELKINLVDARGGGMLMSPRETDESDAHHVELLSISGLPEEKEDDQNTDLSEETKSDNIRKIQYSFGVVSVPVLKEGESWCCNLEIRWHRPKSVMVYVSLGYNPGDVDQRVNVHRSLQIEGKVPFFVNHRFMMSFRREPLLISNIRSLISPLEEKKVSLAFKENNIVVVSAKNCTDVPLNLVSMKIVPEGGTDSSQKLFVVQEISGISNNCTRFVPGEEFRGVFSIIPQVSKPSLSLGVVCVEWMRENQKQDQPEIVTTKHSLPQVCVEDPPLVAAIECPPFAIVGDPFSVYIKVKNNTNLLQEIKYSLGDSQNFVFCGAHVHSASVFPGKEHVLSYKFVPFSAGVQQLPRITITSVRYSAQLTPSIAAGTIFVYPTEPKFTLEKNGSELVV
ncbi:hypothetical protein LUZ61_000284 [Rhynchospora tenuis]|uniref:Trafficking protein particle complex subunit 11 n=1 Tax=Rhynchospora tenuis TaxID=198213 RepID=A0AAD6EPN6_9POAL|nr:hypothetical protein LUZ61_000284 [Rhynchospora tenuis]